MENDVNIISMNISNNIEFNLHTEKLTRARYQYYKVLVNIDYVNYFMSKLEDPEFISRSHIILYESELTILDFLIKRLNESVKIINRLINSLKKDIDLKYNRLSILFNLSDLYNIHDTLFEIKEHIIKRGTKLKRSVATGTVVLPDRIKYGAIPNPIGFECIYPISLVHKNKVEVLICEINKIIDYAMLDRTTREVFINNLNMLIEVNKTNGIDTTQEWDIAIYNTDDDMVTLL